MRYSLVIDGNYFLFKTLYVTSQSSGELLGTASDREVYVRKLAIDLAYQIRLLDGFIDKVVWTLDSKSWRKDFFPQAEYKGTRKHDSQINWEGFTQVIEEFKGILQGHGAQISKVDGAEGDDLIYAWCTSNMANGKSTMIMTGDRDMLQLVSMNQTGPAHTILWAPVHKQLYVPIGLREWSQPKESNDFFETLRSGTSTREHVNQIITLMTTKGKGQLNEVDAVEEQFCKVLTGDSGDNVPPAYWYSITKGDKTRTYGVTPDKARKVVADFRKKHGELNPLFLFSAEHVNDLANTLIRVVNAKHMSQKQIVGNIHVNVNLMILSSRTIPEGILDEMFKHIEETNAAVADLNKLSNMKAMLEGTQYLTDGPAMKVSSSIFKGEQADEDFSFITDRKKPGAVF